ncbi:hypothetical protein ACEWY4_018035 [Coilia grayii]|uniref:Uncharacterized protein n=1 Tax=Coilia grayii TaxID=363190 RepID=A0ABD1JLD2_9TELE
MSLFEGLLFHRGRIFNDCITQLHCVADRLDDTQKKTKRAGIAGGAAGAVGVAAAVAGAILAPCTMGASLALTAAGVGMAAAGGAGGAVAVKNKVSNTKERKKVEEIMQDYKTKMEDVEASLVFISVGMERLSRIHSAVVRGMDEDIMTVLRLAQVISSQGVNLRLHGRCSALLDEFTSSMDTYFSKKDQQKSKKSKIARKIRKQAELMKDGLDELRRIRDRIRSAAEQVVMY